MPRVSASTLGLGLPLSLPQQGSNLNARGLRWDGNALRRWMSVEYRAHVRVEHHGVAKSTLGNYRSRPFRLDLHCFTLSRRGKRARDRQASRVPFHVKCTRQGRRETKRQSLNTPVPLRERVGGWEMVPRHVDVKRRHKSAETPHDGDGGSGGNALRRRRAE